MRKILAVSAALLIGATAFAQVNSHDGLLDGDAHFNHAWRGITLEADLPNQVSFQLPAVSFAIDLEGLQPNYRTSLRIAVRNTSDRPILVEDANFTKVNQLGFFLMFDPVEIEPNSIGYVRYYFEIGDVDDYQALFDHLATRPSVPGVYNYNGDKLFIYTALTAEGQFDPYPGNQHRVNYNFPSNP